MFSISLSSTNHSSLYSFVNIIIITHRQADVETFF